MKKRCQMIENRYKVLYSDGDETNCEYVDYTELTKAIDRAEHLLECRNGVKSVSVIRVTYERKILKTEKLFERGKII